jgi:predicted heme/steroid binding protein/uncharacterized membrane protein
MKEFDENELQQYNGQDGQPIYIAHGGKVYDVTDSKLWRKGMHMKRHRAGSDLTPDIQAAPHSADVLERYPQVGILKKEEIPERDIPAILAAVLNKWPFLERHPHPMTVHFPIAFMLATSAFTLLYLITGVEGFDTSAFYCLGAGVLFNAVGISTGFYTWWLNYMAKPSRAVKIKQRLSITLLALSIIAFIWRLADPEVLISIGFGSYIYIAIVLSFIPIITVIGWFGASLTFPVDH